MYRSKNTRKWIIYDDGGQEPVAEHENINLKRHDPTREWFVVDKPAEYRPDRLAPEAFHARHRNEEYMRSPVAPGPRTRRASEPPQTAEEGWKGNAADVADGTSRIVPTFVRTLPTPPRSEDVFCDGLCAEDNDTGKKNFPAHGLTGHAAVDLTTGMVRLLENGLDPNKLPAPPAPRRTDNGWVMPTDASDRGDAPSATGQDANNAPGQNAAPAATRETALPGRPGSLLSDPTYWLRKTDPHSAPVAKLERAEQRRSEGGAWGKVTDAAARMGQSIGQAVDKGTEAAGQALGKGAEAAGEATGKAIEALGDARVREGLTQAVKNGEKGAREAVAQTVDTFANDPRMHEGLKTFGEYAVKTAAVTALGLTPVEVYGAAGTAMAAWARAHPEAVQAAQDFVGNFIPGDVPVQSKASMWGSGIAWVKDSYVENKPR